MPQPEAELTKITEQGWIFPTPAYAMIVNEELLKGSGEAHVVINPNGLESALHAPFAGFGDYEAYSTFVEKLTYLAYGFSKAHAFENGNKRTLYALVVDTLRLNGFAVVWEPQTAFVVSSLVAAGHLDEAGLQLALTLAVGGDPTLDPSALNPPAL